MNNKERSKKEIDRLWRQIVDIFKESYDIKEYRINTHLVHNVPEIDIIRKPHRKKIQVVKLSYKNKEYIIEGGNGADVLVNFICDVGVEKVYNLKLSTAGTFLVTKDEQSVKGKNPKKLKDYYIVTKNGNREKHSLISEIIAKTGYDASVELGSKK